MSGIKVPQYNILKINTAKLRYHKWDIDISESEAIKCGEIVALFEGQEFRLIAQILDKPTTEINYFDYIVIVEIASSVDFDKVCSHGVIINGNLFKRFVGTSGGLKNNTLLFVNNEVLPALNEKCDCGRKQISIVPAKLEAYKALTCSASQPICDPEGILVVPDCTAIINADVLKIDDSDPKAVEPIVELEKNKEIENTVSDGFNLCTIGYMEKVSQCLGLDYVADGVCLRNAWLKGMLYPFPIIEFFDEVVERQDEEKYFVRDIWGNLQDIRKCEMILTESSLKLWAAYNSIDDYIKKYKDNGYCFSVTKISPKKLEDQRELNYQYLQSYSFTDSDIQKLCSPTVKFLKDACCGDYKTTKEFLGLREQPEHGTWQDALFKSKFMLSDPYIRDSVHRMLRKKIDNAKIGKLLVNGNYQICSGDPYALMQSICDLGVTGLLKANEIYSQYWVDKGVKEVVVFRSPMTSHNNIRKCTIPSNEETSKWYRYMSTIFIYNGFDTICQALNGMDADGDLVFTTDNEVLLSRYKELPAIECIQRNVEKVIPTEKDIIKTDKAAMGNKVGVITNRVTAMMEVQSHFKEDSKEYEELQKRIECGQLYQQNEIDKIKGIVAKPMPPYWYSIAVCNNLKNKTQDEIDFQKSICVNKKPYFMIYVYEDYRVKYKNYITQSNKSSIEEFGITLDELLKKKNKSQKQKEFVKYFVNKTPFGMGLCSVNKICFYIEEQFKNNQIEIKNDMVFDYTKLRYDCDISDVHKTELMKLMKEYISTIQTYKKNENGSTKISDSDNKAKNRMVIKKHYKDATRKICPDDKERLNIILDLCYGKNGNMQYCWDCIGDLIVRRIEELDL